MSKLIPLNDTIIIELVEEETKSAGGIVMTGSAKTAKNRAVVVAGGDSEEFVGESDTVQNGDIIIFKEDGVLAHVGNEMIIAHASILAKVK